MFKACAEAGALVMNPHRHKLISIALLAIAFIACSKQEQPATPAQPAATQPAQSQSSAGESAAAVAEAPATTEESAPAAPPTETVTETEDAQESADQPASSGQPGLRLATATNTPPTSERFKEGPNYKKVLPAQPTNVAPGKVEVVEVFWYGCAHCFQLDPAIESWRNKGKPQYVEFVRIPAMWNDTLRMHARLYYTAEALGKLDTLHSTIFREMHVNNDPLNTMDKLTAFFKKQGVSPEDFQKTFASFAVESKLQRADFLNRRYQVNSVPTVVVNGKYVTDVSMAGGEPQLFQLIDELAAHEHGG
jgi:protein dithiol oxidoreductase (disulfide-forming)